MTAWRSFRKNPLPIRLDRRAWWRVAVASAGGLVSGLSGAGLVALIGQAAETRTATGAMAAAFAGLCLLHLASKVGSELALLQVAQTLVLKLRISLSRKLLATPLRRLQSLGSAGLLAILTEDLAVFAQCSQLLPVLFCNAVVVLVCLGYLAWIAWPVFLALLAFFVLAAGWFVWAQRRPARHFVEVREQTDVLYRDLRSLVEGSKQLQLNPKGASHFLKQVLQPGAERLRRTFVAGMGGYIWIANLGAVQFFIAIGLVIFAVPRWLPGYAAALPTVIVMLLYLAQPIGALLTAAPTLRQALVSLRKAQQLDDSLDERQPFQAQSASPFGKGVQTLVVAGVTHAHERGFSVGPIDMTIPLGKVSYIVGPNGSGKTTLALLLLGLYLPDQGRILLNGVPVTPENVLHYRSRFSAVFADFHLFERLLAPIDPATAARAQRYLHRLDMDGKVSLVDGSFSTLALSTGQRKRLALLVAYLEDRPIYLFDEWASDQDPVFKRLFYTELLPELRARGKTVIVITHDDQYFEHADCVIELHDGQSRLRTA